MAGNDNLLPFLGKRFDKLVHDRFTTVFESKPDNDCDCRSKTNANTPCNWRNKRVDYREIKFQLRECKYCCHEIQKDTDQNQYWFDKLDILLSVVSVEKIDKRVNEYET